MKKMKKRLEVGDEVSFVIVARRARGVVVEDRGSLGGGGRRVLRVRVQYDSSPSMDYEIREEDLKFEHAAGSLVAA